MVCTPEECELKIVICKASLALLPECIFIVAVFRFPNLFPFLLS